MVFKNMKLNTKRKVNKKQMVLLETSGLEGAGITVGLLWQWLTFQLFILKNTDINYLKIR